MENNVNIYARVLPAVLKIKGEEFPRKFFMKWSEYEQLWFVGYTKSMPSNMNLMNSNTVGYAKTSIGAVDDLVRLLAKLKD